VRKSIHTREQAALLKLLKQVRNEACLTQKQLAERLQVQQCEISNYERGEKRLDLIELGQVVDALGLSLEEFVRRYETKIKSG
jgi:transcriptional regulator with XRE-family HTH domain